ncbi:MAG: hypothetical protein HQ595_02080, partial [Candidatus Omnitrophica bacterium]|nr:hypothetical protein [Candidatus Omnitrophota bacterium]
MEKDKPDAHELADSPEEQKKSRTEQEAARGQGLSLWFDYRSKRWLKVVACVVIAAFLHQDVVWAVGTGYADDIKQMLQQPAQKMMDRLGALFSVRAAYAWDESDGSWYNGYSDNYNSTYNNNSGISTDIQMPEINVNMGPSGLEGNVVNQYNDSYGQFISADRGAVDQYLYNSFEEYGLGQSYDELAIDLWDTVGMTGENREIAAELCENLGLPKIWGTPGESDVVNIPTGIGGNIPQGDQLVPTTFRAYGDPDTPGVWKSNNIPVDLGNVGGVQLAPFSVNPRQQATAATNLGRADAWMPQSYNYEHYSLPDGINRAFPLESFQPKVDLEAQAFNHGIVRTGEESVVHKGRAVNYSNQPQHFEFGYKGLNKGLGQAVKQINASQANNIGQTGITFDPGSGRYHGYNSPDDKSLMVELNKGDSVRFNSNTIDLTSKNQQRDYKMNFAAPGDTLYGAGPDYIQGLGATKAQQQAMIQPNSSDKYNVTIDRTGMASNYENETNYGYISNLNNVQIGAVQWKGSSADAFLGVERAYDGPGRSKQVLVPHGIAGEIVTGKFVTDKGKWDQTIKLGNTSQHNVTQFSKNAQININAESITATGFSGTEFSRSINNNDVSQFQASGKVEGMEFTKAGYGSYNLNPQMQIPHLTERVQDAQVSTFDPVNRKWDNAYLGKNKDSGLDSVLSVNLRDGSTVLAGTAVMTDPSLSRTYTDPITGDEHQITDSSIYQGKAFNLNSEKELRVEMMQSAVGMTSDRQLPEVRGPGSFKVESIYQSGDVHDNWKKDHFANISRLKLENEHDGIPIMDGVTISQHTERRFDQIGAPDPVTGWWMKAQPGQETGSIASGKTNDFEQWSNAGIKTLVVDDVRAKGDNFGRTVVRSVKTAIEFPDQNMLEWQNDGNRETWGIRGADTQQKAAQLIADNKIRLLTPKEVGGDAHLLHTDSTMESARQSNGRWEFSEQMKRADIDVLNAVQDFDITRPSFKTYEKYAENFKQTEQKKQDDLIGRAFDGDYQAIQQMANNYLNESIPLAREQWSPTTDYQLGLTARGDFYHPRQFISVSPEEEARLKSQSRSGTTFSNLDTGETMAANLVDGAEAKPGRSTMLGSSMLDGSSTNIDIRKSALGNLSAEGSIGYVLAGKSLSVHENLGQGARGRFLEDVGEITTISPGTQNFGRQDDKYDVKKYEVWNIEAKKGTQFAFGGAEMGKLGGIRIGQPLNIDDQVEIADKLFAPSVTGEGRWHYHYFDRKDGKLAAAAMGRIGLDQPVAIDTAQKVNEVRLFSADGSGISGDVASALFNKEATQAVGAPGHATVHEVGRINDQIREYALDWSDARLMQNHPTIESSTKELANQDKTLTGLSKAISDNIIHYDARDIVGTDNPIALGLGAGNWQAKTTDDLTLLYQGEASWNGRQQELLHDLFGTRVADLKHFQASADKLFSGEIDSVREIVTTAKLEDYQPSTEAHIFAGQDGLAKIGNETKMWLDSPDITFNFKTKNAAGKTLKSRDLTGFRRLKGATELSEQMRPFLEKFSGYQPDHRGEYIQFKNAYKIYGEFAKDKVSTRMAQDFGQDLARVNSENIHKLLDDVVGIGKGFNVDKIEAKSQKVSDDFSEHQDRQRLAADLVNLYNDIPDISIEYEENEDLDQITRQAWAIRGDEKKLIFSQKTPAEYNHSDHQLKIPAHNDFLDFAFSISSGKESGELGTSRTKVNILGIAQPDEKFFSLFNTDTDINALALGEVFAKTDTWVFNKQGGNLAIAGQPIRRYFEGEIKLTQTDQGIKTIFDPGLRQQLLFNEPQAAKSLASGADFMLVYGEGSQWEARQDAQGNTFFAGLNLKDDPGKYIKFGGLHGVMDLQKKPKPHSFDSDVVTWNEQQQALNFRFKNPEFNPDTPSASPMFKVDLAQLDQAASASNQRNTGGDPLRTTIETDTLVQARQDKAHNIFHDLDPATKTEHTLANRKYDQYKANIEYYGLSMTPFSDTALPSANIEPTYVGFGRGYEARVAKAGRPQEGLDLLVKKFDFQDNGDYLSRAFGDSSSVPMQMNGLEMFQGAYYYQPGQLAIEAGTSSPGQIQQDIKGMFRSVRKAIEERPLISRRQTPDGRILEVQQPGISPLHPDLKVTDLYARYPVAEQPDGSLEHLYRRGTAMSVWDKLFPDSPMAAELWSNVSRDLSDSIMGEKGTKVVVEALGFTLSEPLQKAEVRNSQRFPGIGPDGFGKVPLDYQMNRTETDEVISVDFKLYKANEIVLPSESASMLSGLLDRAPEETYIITPQHELRADPVGSEIASLTIDGHKFTGEVPSVLFFAIDAKQQAAITPVTVQLDQEQELTITLNALKIPLANGKEAAMGALAGQIPWKGETSVDGLTIHLEDQAITVYGGWKLYADNNIEVYRAGQDKFLEEAWSEKNAGGAASLSGTLAQVAMQSFPGRGVGVENIEWGKGEEAVTAYRYAVFDGYNSAQGPLIAGSPLLAPGSEFSPAEVDKWLEFAGDKFKRLERGRYSAEMIDDWHVGEPVLIGQANQDGARKIFGQSAVFSDIEFDVTDPMIQIADTAHNYNVQAGIFQDDMKISRYNIAGPMLLHKEAEFSGPVLFFAENNFAGSVRDNKLTTVQGSINSFDLTELISKVEQRSIAQGLPFDREAFVSTIGREG